MPDIAPPTKPSRLARLGSVCRTRMVTTVAVFADSMPASRVGCMSRRIAAVVLVATVVGGCSETVDLPDRTDPAVQAEEARIATVLEFTDDIWVPQPRRCSIRLLGHEGAISYVWANCEGPEVLADGQLERPAQGGPMRIDGDRVSEPRDGGLRGSDIRDMFPAELADAILAGHEGIYP